MKKIILTAASILAMSGAAQAEVCSIFTAGEDQKLECVQAKLENKIARLSSLLTKMEAKLDAKREEELAEDDDFNAASLRIMMYASREIREELLETQEQLAKLVAKHHELDARADVKQEEAKAKMKEAVAKAKEKAERVESKIEEFLRRIANGQ